jgi:predicted GTPase
VALLCRSLSPQGASDNISAAANGHAIMSKIGDALWPKTNGLRLHQTDPKKPLLILLGKTGNGKSSFANFAIGQTGEFKIGDGALSETTDFQIGYCEFLDCYVVDTPGFGDVRADMETTMTDKEIIRNIGHLIKFTGCPVLAMIVFSPAIQKGEKRILSEIATPVRFMHELMGLTVASRLVFTFRASDEELNDYGAAKSWSTDQCCRLIKNLEKLDDADPLRKLVLDTVHDRRVHRLPLPLPATTRKPQPRSRANASAPSASRT